MIKSMIIELFGYTYRVVLNEDNMGYTITRLEDGEELDVVEHSNDIEDSMDNIIAELFENICPDCGGRNSCPSCMDIIE